MKTIIAANWKMYKTRAEAAETGRDLASRLQSLKTDRMVLVFAPFTAIAAAADELRPFAAVGAQDVYPAQEGAFTGEISPAMIKDCGAEWVLTGHSERRHILHESSDFVGRKTAFALKEGLSVMLCIGETLAEREAGQLERVLSSQLEPALRDLPKDILADRFAIAYEPVWAIGTGKVASESDIAEAHGMIRNLLSKFLGSVAGSIPLLYGGSVKPANAPAILKLDNVNGLLVGGASLKAESFSQIVTA